MYKKIDHILGALVNSVTYSFTQLSILLFFVVSLYSVVWFTHKPLHTGLAHLKEDVIAPTLRKIGLYSQNSEKLIFGTAMQESCGGTLSTNVFQIEPATASDIMQNYLPAHPGLNSKIQALYNHNHPLNWNLSHNLPFEAAMARLVYLRSVPNISSDSTPTELGTLWKRYYNTYKGKGTVGKFVNMYQNSTNGNVPQCFHS